MKIRFYMKLLISQRYYIILSAILIFFFVANKHLSAQNSVLPETNYKYKVVLKVCENIAKAQGANKPIPVIKIFAKGNSQNM